MLSFVGVVCVQFLTGQQSLCCWGFFPCVVDCYCRGGSVGLFFIVVCLCYGVSVLFYVGVVLDICVAENQCCFPSLVINTVACLWCCLSGVVLQYIRRC